MAVLALVLFIVCDLVGFAVGYFLPLDPWTPYVSLLVSYHLFLICMIVILGKRNEQKIGVSFSIPMAVVIHIAFVGALIVVVFVREYVPWFSVVRYALPALAPFEAKWLFEGQRKEPTAPEPQRMHKTQDEYNEFLAYLHQKDRTLVVS